MKKMEKMKKMNKTNKTKHHRYKLKGLSCASCAVKIEDELKKLGCRVVMVTGDSKEIAQRVASRLEIGEYFAELLPEDKVRVVEKLGRVSKVAFAGDGINDAPVIAGADAGIAMGGLEARLR